jgi:DNA-binding LacI/PurR family transcriptional regulator
LSWLRPDGHRKWASSGTLGATSAQQPRRQGRIGIILVNAENDPEGQVRIRTFHQALEGMGWAQSRNLQTDYRWGAGDPERAQTYAEEMVAQAPDAIVAMAPLPSRPCSA